MRIRNGFNAIVACAMLMPGAVLAATINVGNSNLNGNTVSDFGVDGLVDFDLFVNNSGLTILTLDLTAAEMAAGMVSLRMGGVVDALAGGFDTARISVGGANSFGLVGDAADSANNPVPVDATSNSGRMTFTPAELSFFTIGDLGGSSIDWIIDFPTNASSIKLTVSIKEGPAVVPLPAGVWLLMSAMVGLGLIRRRTA